MSGTVALAFFAVLACLYLGALTLKYMSNRIDTLRDRVDDLEKRCARLR